MHPIRVAFWLVVTCLALVGGQLVATGWILGRFDARFAALGPWTVDEIGLVDDVHVRLVGALLLGLGLSGVLAGAAMAVSRRSPYTRAVVSSALLLVAVALLLGIVYSPDSALLAQDERQLAHLQRLLPLWYSAVQSTVVAAVIVVSVVAVLRLGRDQAVDYYQQHDPTATWRGFTSWLDVARGGEPG